MARTACSSARSDLIAASAEGQDNGLLVYVNDIAALQAGADAGSTVTVNENGPNRMQFGAFRSDRGVGGGPGQRPPRLRERHRGPPGRGGRGIDGDGEREWPEPHAVRRVPI